MRGKIKKIIIAAFTLVVSQAFFVFPAAAQTGTIEQAFSKKCAWENTGGGVPCATLASSGYTAFDDFQCANLGEKTTGQTCCCIPDSGKSYQVKITSTTSPKAAVINPFDTLNVKIPGLYESINCKTDRETGKVVCPTIKCDEQNTDCQIPWLAQYITAIFKYSLIIVGILAAVMLMAAGILWLISGDNATRMKLAKDMITGSISGLVILFASYFIIYQINPDLINLKSISLTYVKKIEFINPYEIQGCVGQWASNNVYGSAFSNEVVSAIKKESTARNIDPCYYYAIISQESKGDAGALADDRAVANCNIGARKKFICSKYPECCGKECTDQKCRSFVEDETIMPAEIDKNNPVAGLDLTGGATYGFGLGQITYRKEYGLCNNNKGFNYMGKCYNFVDLFDPTKNLQAMSDGAEKYYCPEAKNNGKPSVGCFKKYAGTGAWATCTGTKKMSVYQKCVNDGFDNIVKKNWVINLAQNPSIPNSQTAP